MHKITAFPREPIRPREIVAWTLVVIFGAYSLWTIAPAVDRRLRHFAGTGTVPCPVCDYPCRPVDGPDGRFQTINCPRCGSASLVSDHGR